MRAPANVRMAESRRRLLTAGRGSLPLTTGHRRQVTAYVAAVRESDLIDRAAWAKLLAELLNSAGLTPEQATDRAGGPVRAPWRTIRKWLGQETGVSVRKVRDVARDLGYPPTHALVQVGFLSREEAGMAGPVRPGPIPDPLLRRLGAALNDTNIPEDARGRLRRALQHAYDIWLEWMKTSAQDLSRPVSKGTRSE